VASIKRRPDGTWRARYRDDTGKEHAHHAPTKAAAQRWLDSQTASLVRGDWTDPKFGKTTFGEVERKVAELKDLRNRATTRARDATLMNSRILPTFKDQAVASITPGDIEKWVASMNAVGLAPATVHKCYQLAARVMSEAVKRGYIGASPCRDVDLPRLERVEEAVLLTPQQVDNLAGVIDARYRALVLTAAYTGLRWGELAAVRVARLDFLRRRVAVENTLVEVDGAMSFGAPKTKQSRANLSLPVPVVELLAAQVATYPDPDPDRGLVFTSDQGTPLRRSNFARRIWQPACVAAGLGAMVDVEEAGNKRYRGATFHDLRHATASWLIDAGANPLEVAAKLRHAKVTTTLSVYGHLFPGVDERVDGFLEAMYERAGENPADRSRTNRRLSER
jgi:integrase